MMKYQRYSPSSSDYNYMWEILYNAVDVVLLTFCKAWEFYCRASAPPQWQTLIVYQIVFSALPEDLGGIAKKTDVLLIIYIQNILIIC